MSEPLVRPRWFTPGREDAETRLFLFAHAGSGAAAFRGYEDLVPAGVAAQAVTLPGRQGRRAEALPTDWAATVDELHEAVVAELDGRPYALFGHCLGAQLAYRLAVRLAEAGDEEPVLLGVSGWAPTGFFRAPANHAEIPKADMVAWIRDLGAIPDAVAADPDLLDLVLPPVIADFRLAADHVDDGAVVDVPLVTYVGRQDTLMLDPDAMRCWADRAAHYLGHRDYGGGHFYLDAHKAAVMSDFTAHLARLT
ncbi:thioesterase II family protein [Actinokineospora globicatena]|uniref:thioesterase II family protein n=1 Tax=Actinokineospora globicatena TaxID=103729 RepID=UPI0020A613CA|nr:alpha/beta fold hydrolase [Actinokineospora globicatena]MCP2303549.1 Surfactin synthase thioesterase subunit [Actinokineospora globicatena]GLW79314.1 thioesterase [Actinokineospora globicatena]GLW86276.1 thioesterase [Actinokineospora globicatena]